MERLILGIIAVICLHIGYVAYVFTEQPIVDAAWTPTRSAPSRGPVRNETFARISPVDEVRSALEDDNDGETERALGRSIRRRTNDSDSTMPVGRRIERYSARVDTDDTAEVAAPFKSVTIEIPRPYIPKMPFEPDRPAVKASVQKTDNKSFFASVLPVFKKPYGWIKALGSKLR